MQIGVKIGVRYIIYIFIFIYWCRAAGARGSKKCRHESVNFTQQLKRESWHNFAPHLHPSTPPPVYPPPLYRDIYNIPLFIISSYTVRVFLTVKCRWTTELKDDRMEKYGSLFVFISKKHCCATLKNLLADGRGGWVADGRLCKSRVAAKFSFLYFRKIFTKFLILCYAKFSSKFAKLKIKNFANILQPPYVLVEWGGWGRAVTARVHPPR